MGLAQVIKDRGTTFAADDANNQSAAKMACFAWMTPQEARSTDFISAWDKLAQNACEPNPFYESWFALPSFEAFGTRTAIQIATVYDRGELIGLLPMERSNSYYGYPIRHLSSWLHTNAFCGVPLIREGSEELFWTRLITASNTDTRTCLFVHLPSLPADGPANQALKMVLAHSGTRFADVHSKTRAMLASALSPDDYLANALSTKRRKELRRQKRRLAEQGSLKFERLSDEAGIEQWIDEFLKLEAAGWKGDAGSALHSDSQTSEFFRAALLGAAKAGRLERLTMRLDGHAVAMLANLISSPGAFSFKTAFDEDYAAHSPGVLLQLENLTMLARVDVKWTDSCAMQGHSMIERVWKERRQLISRNIAIGGQIRRLAFSALAAYETRSRSQS